MTEAEIGQLIEDLHSDSSATAQLAWAHISKLIRYRGWKEEKGWNFETPDREWLIKDWLPLGRIGLLTGEGEKGKSLLALQLAAKMASGGGFWLRRGIKLTMPAVSEGVAVIANWEDEAHEARRRLDWIENADRADGQTTPLAERVGESLRYLEMAQAGPVWTADGLSPIGRQLRDYCEEHDARLLVLDPLINAYGATENANEEAAHFMADWGGWAQEAKCTVLLCHHPPKADRKDRQEGADHGFRGASAFSAEARFHWQLTDKTEDDGPTITVLRRRKGNYAAPNASKEIYLDKSKKTHWIWRVAGDQPQQQQQADSDPNGTSPRRQRTSDV
jgi:RecA-family ATPase